MLTEKEIENSKYKDIYYKNLPDKDTEFFWYCFKESIDNLINNLENNKQKEMQYLIDELNDKCNLLNQLQKNEKYDDINLEIEKYLKPQILIDLSEYFPIKEDLIKMGYLKDDLPSNWSLEKAIKKGRV